SMKVRRLSALINLTYAPESACPEALLTTPSTLPANSAARTDWTLANSPTAATTARIRLPWLNIVSSLAGIDSLAFRLPSSIHRFAYNRGHQKHFFTRLVGKKKREV